MEPYVQEAQAWAQTHFGSADLRDIRRTKRLVRLASQVTAHPSGSFPEQTENWNDLRAAYNLFDREEATFQAVATPHWELTKATNEKRLLLLEDTTEIDFGSTRKIKGGSPVGSGSGLGFHLHSALMVSSEGERAHGLAGQLIYHRQPVPKGETRTQRLQRDDRESQIWATWWISSDRPHQEFPGFTWLIGAQTTSSSITTVSRPERIGWPEPRT
jgi:hypothetical protein